MKKFKVVVTRRCDMLAKVTHVSGDLKVVKDKLLKSPNFTDLHVLVKNTDNVLVAHSMFNSDGWNVL